MRINHVLYAVLVITLGTTANAQMRGSEFNDDPVILAQARQHWLIGTWVWDSEWGPIIMVVTGVGNDGRPVGTIENKRFNWYRSLSAKASASEVLAMIKGTNLTLDFRGTGDPNYDLNFQGNSLVGRYKGRSFRGGEVTRDVSFNKR